VARAERRWRTQFRLRCPRVISTASPLIWYTTRATGVVGLVLLTASVCLGVLTTTRLTTRRLPRFAVSELHSRISMIATVFVALHVVTAILDTYVPIGLLASVVPFTSGYRPLPVALGTAAFDLLLAVAVTSAARRLLSPRAWRGAHWLAYACWPIAFIHGLLVGTDLRFGWMQILAGTCAAAILSSIVWRVRADPYQGGFRTADPQQPRGRTALDKSVSQSTTGRARRPNEGSAEPRLIARYTWTTRR
jgi:methionine sulfoxide reductase heme-binding subunit